MNEYLIPICDGTRLQEFEVVFNAIKELSFVEFLRFEIGESESEVKLLLGALILFSRHDAETLFNKQKDVDERAMAGCIYRYMYVAQLMGYCVSVFTDIDIEYDRMKVDADNLGSKAYCMCATSREACSNGQYEKCGDFINSLSESRGLDHYSEKHVRTDLIIHNRNSEPGCGNGMIVEFKRDAVEGSDDIKIAYATCLNGTLKYKCGAEVRLSREIQVVTLYNDSHKMCTIKVGPSSVEA